jgi:hypothetical protein
MTALRVGDYKSSEHVPCQEGPLSRRQNDARGLDPRENRSSVSQRLPNEGQER